MLENEDRLFFANDGVNEYVIKYRDIPDFIVDYNQKKNMTDLEFYEYGDDSFKPCITTFGWFLNKCDPSIRKDIIDRLVYLQQGGKIKRYKIIDEDTFQKAIESCHLSLGGY